MNDSRTQHQIVKQESGWQPIETAPKDGTEIMVVSNGGIRVAYWDNAGWIKGWFIPASDDHSCGGTYAAPPTHWMPLPPPPQEAER